MSDGEGPAAFDVVVIGGGANGTGTARDLALRGLKVALFEKRDFGAGATGASSGMIHGGARYLTHEPSVTKLSCTDSGAIQKIASHMIFRIPFIFPMVQGARVQGLPARLALHLTDSMLYAYDLYQPLKGGLPHQRLTAQEALELEPGLTPQIVGAVTWDEWGIDAARLCLANALSAAEAGAVVRNHCQILGLVREPSKPGAPGALCGVRVQDRTTGERFEVRARAVLNAAGPWSELVAGAAGATVKLRPAKGVHLVIGGRLTNYALSTQAIDGRIIFLEPWQDVTLIGTTDDDFYGDLDDLEATFDEASYLLEAVATIFPSIREHRVIDTWVGVRPTLSKYGPNEDDLSREHRVFDHREEGVEGFFSLAGGKLAAYRLMSEESDAICEFLGHDATSRTASELLPGAEGELRPARWAGDFDLSEAVLRKLSRRQGSRLPRIFEGGPKRPGERVGALTCRCEQVLEGEIRHVIRREWAQTLGDVMRRTRLGTGPCGGVRCAYRAAQLLAQELDRPASWALAEAERFLVRRYRSRRPALSGLQARATALDAVFLALHGPTRSGGEL